jgi:hypothetical protein
MRSIFRVADWPINTVSRPLAHAGSFVLDCMNAKPQSKATQQYCDGTS